MVTRALTLHAGGALAGTVLDLDSGAPYAALLGGKGFGLADVEVRWFQGAGDGDSYRGTRVKRRAVPLPILIQAPNADVLQEHLDLLSMVLDPEHAPATLRVDQGQHAWTVDVVRTAGGDPQTGTETNGSSWAVWSLVLESGEPHWVREEPSVQTITPGGLGRGLLQGTTSLTMLRLSSSQAMGNVPMENPGTARAFPVVRVNGPGTHLDLVSARGETLTWDGVLTAGQFRLIDHETKTIVDQDGVDRYDELGTAPQFWSVPPGLQTAYVELVGATTDSSVNISWRPRRWLVT